ncbi:MAG: YihY/virulence factor BrkB family protein [Qingshengfaniella sp.]
MTAIRQGWALFKGMGARIDAADLSLVAAGGAFFTMLSMFPGLAAVIALLGVVSDPAIVDDQLSMLSDFVPPQAFAILETQIVRLVAANSSVLGWATVLSTLTALWSARRGTDALIKALNRVFHAPPRGGIMANAVALGMTLVLMLVMVVALVAMVVLPVVVAILPLGALAEVAIGLVRWVVALVVVVTGIWVLYRFSPNMALRQTRWVTPGTVLAIVVWTVASFLFSSYLTNFGSYNEVYGSIGAVVALLMFLYITIFAVLLGATLNAELWQMGPASDITQQDEEEKAEEQRLHDRIVDPEGAQG